MRRGADFATTVRRGRRAAAPALVVHLHAAPGDGTSSPLDEPTIGFVVSRAVGTAVTRNLVRRRLRHLLRDRLDLLPTGSSLVIRALPASARATTPELAGDLDAALERVLRSAGVRS